jgi:hypothetical protein
LLWPIRGYILGIRNRLKLQMWGWNWGIKFAAKNENLMKLRGAQFLLAFVCLGQMAARAQNLDTIGVTLLQTVTTNLNGAGIRVAQPEANVDSNTNDPSAFEVKPATVNQPAGLFTYISAAGTTNTFSNSVGNESGHADNVAGYFYGIPGSVATNVAHVDNYDAEFFYTNYVANSLLSDSGDSVVNQSFTFDALTVSDQQMVDSQYDNYAVQNHTLLVSAANNADNSVTVCAPGTSYNCISVGAYANFTYYNSIGPTIDNGRAKPDITAPANATSFSTPQVAGAAAVLMQAGLRGDGGSDTNSAANIRTVKALLLNGAIKPADWTNNAPSPLDTRYGAGVLNVFNSYEQLTGGKHGYIVSMSVFTNSPHPPTGATGTVSVLSGWDFNTNTSSSSSDGVNHYYFNVINDVNSATFTATITLVWNRHLNKTNINNLDLFLYDAISSNLVACSTSLVDNIEHIWVPHLTQGRYDLQVLKKGGSYVSANETYALAYEFFSTPLNIASSGTNIVLTWPIYPAGFVLQAATNLAAPVWNTNNPAPTVINSQNCVTLGATNGSQFFRLQRP